MISCVSVSASWQIVSSINDNILALIIIIRIITVNITHRVCLMYHAVRRRGDSTLWDRLQPPTKTILTSFLLLTAISYTVEEVRNGGVSSVRVVWVHRYVYGAFKGWSVGGLSHLKWIRLPLPHRRCVHIPAIINILFYALHKPSSANHLYQSSCCCVRQRGFKHFCSPLESHNFQQEPICVGATICLNNWTSNV